MPRSVCVDAQTGLGLRRIGSEGTFLHGATQIVILFTHNDTKASEADRKRFGILCCLVRSQLFGELSTLHVQPRIYFNPCPTE